ncbi:MAG: hypothetical protein AAF525_12915 [Pseudomonadota bacterium]
MLSQRIHILSLAKVLTVLTVIQPAVCSAQTANTDDENHEAVEPEKGIFKSKDKYGRTIFSDRPTGDAEVVELKEESRYSVQDQVRQYERFTPATTQKPKSFSYTTLAITSPEADEQIRDNRGNVVIGYRVQPTPPPDHNVVLEMDGEPLTAVIGSGSHPLTNIPRGTHQLALVVKNKKGKIIHSSDPISFTLHRFSKKHR